MLQIVMGIAERSTSMQINEWKSVTGVWPKGPQAEIHLVIKLALAPVSNIVRGQVTFQAASMSATHSKIRFSYFSCQCLTINEGGMGISIPLPLLISRFFGQLLW